MEQATATASGTAVLEGTIPGGAPLAVKEGGWNKERTELVRRTICPRGIGEDEFLLFMEQCMRSGLDPLLKQAYCVLRRMNVGSRERPNWINKHEFQPSEAGMLARAERFPDYEGCTSSEAYSEDEIQIDYKAGVVDHVVVPTKRKGTLVGAWARVQRKGKVPVIVWLDFAAMSQSTPLWAKMPAVMIRKCARVAALRTAYPEAFGGLYIAGERPEDGESPEDVVEGSAFTRPPEVIEESEGAEFSDATYEPADTGGEAAPAQAAINSSERPSTGVPAADSLILRAEEVKTEGARLALCEEARSLPRGEARRKVAEALEKAKARLFAEKAAQLKESQTAGADGGEP